MRRIAILDAPSNLGLRPPTETSVPGCAKAPGALRDHDLVARLAARDAGCLTPPRYDPGDWRPGDGVCHAEQIAAYSVALADRIGSIIDAGEFPVVLGGDCSILLGSALAMHRQGEVVGGRIGLVFVDGHSDFRHPGNASYVGAAAGEDLALATGRGQADLAGIEGRRPYYRDVDVVVLGIRAQDEYRLDLQAAGIITRPVPALRVEGAARTAQWARDQLSDCAGYWVHVDVDVLDPAVMPAVDAPDPGGIAFAELELLLSGLVDTPRCLGVEITVFDPDYDPDGSYAAEIVDTVVAGLAPVRMADPAPVSPSPTAVPPARGADSPPSAPAGGPDSASSTVRPGSPPPAADPPAAVVSPSSAPDSPAPRPASPSPPLGAGAPSSSAVPASREGDGPPASTLQAAVPEVDKRATEAIAPAARKPPAEESDPSMASAATQAVSAAAASGARTAPGASGSATDDRPLPPMLGDSAAAEVLAAAAAAAGIRKPPAARKAPDAQPEPEPTGRVKPTKAEPESRRRSGPGSLRRTRDEPESGARGDRESAAGQRGKPDPDAAAGPRGKPDRESAAGPRGKPDRESAAGPRGKPDPDSAQRRKAEPEPAHRRKAEPASAHRRTPEAESAHRRNAEAGSAPGGKAEPDSGRKAEPDPGPRRKAEPDPVLRRKAESAWMDVAADLAARRGTPAERAARRGGDSGPVGLRRADDSGPAMLRRGGAAEPAWKDDQPSPPRDDAASATHDDGQERSAARDNGEAPAEGQAAGGVSVPAFEPFGPPAKAGPGRLRRPKKGPPPAEIA